MTDLVHPAGAARRCGAFVIDRVLAWSVYAGEGYVAYQGQIEPGRVWSGVAAIAGTVLLVGALTSLLIGLYGLTPGMAVLGLRVVSSDNGQPVGIPRAALRTFILGLATLPTAGLGVLALARSAMADPTGWRRGWHDLRAGTVVVDLHPEVDPAPDPAPDAATDRVGEEPEAADLEPAEPVNVTALREVPVEPESLPPLPQRRPAGQRRTPAAPAESLAPAQAPAPTDDDTSADDDTPVEVEAPAGVRAPSRWEVAFDTGERFEVTGLTLVGRRPEPRSDEEVQRLVTLPSDDMSLSKTHAQFEVVPRGALVVMDRGSTNGSLLLRGEVPKRLVSGRPATLRDGDVVRFGDREMVVTKLS